MKSPNVFVTCWSVQQYLNLLSNFFFLKNSIYFKGASSLTVITLALSDTLASKKLRINFNPTIKDLTKNIKSGTDAS